MFTLIALGTGSAYLHSLAATFAPGIFPPSPRGMGGTVPVYYKAAAVITVLALLGQVLKLRAREQTGASHSDPAEPCPQNRPPCRDGADDEEIDVAPVAPGDRLRIRPGEAIPVDGTAFDGSSAVDEFMVTGESKSIARRSKGGVSTSSSLSSPRARWRSSAAMV